MVFGNAELADEHAVTAETWVGGTHRHGRWEVRAFQTDLDDFIDRVAAGDQFHWINRERARYRGVEVAGRRTTAA